MTAGFRSTRFGRLRFVEDGSGPVLLMFHSNGCSSYEYSTAIKLFAPHFRVIAWDMPGQGDSDALQGHLTMADYAAAAIELMDTLDVSRATVIGSSVGSSIAAELAASYPDRVEGAVIVEIPIGRDGRWWDENWSMVERMFSIPHDTFEAMSRRYRGLTDEAYSRLLVDRHKAGRSMMQVMWAGRDASDGLATTLSRIRCPTLFLLGENGVATAVAGRFAELLPGSSLVTLPKCGHFPLSDDPKASVDAVLAFARSKPR